MSAAGRIARAAAVAALAAGGLPAAAVAEAPRPRIDFYRADGTRAAYGWTNPDTGVTTLYDAQTSQRLGQFKRLNDPNATRPDGRRVPEGALGLIPPAPAKRSR